MTVFIRDSDQYPALVKDLGEDLLQKKLLPFTGAGISRAEPSQLAMSFHLINHLYNRLARSTALMNREYYYLRRLEARLFAGVDIENIEEDKNRLDELERSYRLTQNEVQLGNTFAYRGLIAALIDNDRETARQQLRQAEVEWSRGSRFMASGKRRVKLFRRIIR